jgi:hypothetical protein
MTLKELDVITPRSGRQIDVRLKGRQKRLTAILTQYAKIAK